MGTMFEHLDDPHGIDPGRRELDAVLGRTAAMRSRRRRTVPVVLCVALLGASIALVGLRFAPQTSTSTTAYQFDLQNGPLPLGTPVPTTALLSVHFASANDGFALALHRGELLLAASNDGGSTWQVRNNHLLPPGLTDDAAISGQFEFVGSDGYLWGLGSETRAPLWITHDDGLTWHRASIGPDVVDVSAIGLDAWALVRGCPGTAPRGTTATCALALEESLDGGSTWRAAPLDAAGIGASQGSASPPPELARITEQRAYVLEAAPGAGGLTIWRLLFTDDAAATWSVRSVPCSGAFALGAEVAASSTDDIWLLCGGQATAGSQSKQLYRSEDGGLTWQLRALATGLGTPAQTTVRPDPLPLVGYVAPFSIGHRNLAVLTSTTAWIFGSRANLFKTSDGGSTWVPVPSLAAAGFASGGAGNVTFLSATQGWICEYGIGLWHTDDGVLWSPLGAR
jgi:photosystem II stability/assembly factor-like uncharacterized protein